MPRRHVLAGAAHAHALMRGRLDEGALGVVQNLALGIKIVAVHRSTARTTTLLRLK